MRLPPLAPSFWASLGQGLQTYQELAVWADQLLVQDGPQSRVLGRLLGSMLRAPELTMELAVDGVSSVSASMPWFATTSVIVHSAGYHLNVPGQRQWGPGVGSPVAGSAYLSPAWEARHDYRYDGWKLHYDEYTRLTLYVQRLDLVEE